MKRSVRGRILLEGCLLKDLLQLTSSQVEEEEDSKEEEEEEREEDKEEEDRGDGE